jgi:hypothetical protein
MFWLWFYLPKCIGQYCALSLCPGKRTCSFEVEVEVNLRPTASWPVCLGVELPSGAHDQIFVFCLTIAGFLMWGTLSDERIGL